jgi:hypothetical protein
VNATSRPADPAPPADRIAAALDRCPVVARRTDGPIGTYLPDRVVRGVAVREGAVRVAVVAVYGPPLAEVADRVRAVVSRCAPGHRVDVEIDDLALPDEPAGRR